MNEAAEHRGEDCWPLAVVTSSQANPYSPTARIVRVRCPLCGQLHTHGAPDGGSRLGHRVAHCKTRIEPHGYVIVDPNDRATAGWQKRHRDRQ
jgi:hypothetical protein